MARPTVAIVYGFAEGPWCSTAFRAALQASGFTVTNDATKADCIVAHSGGHLLLPKHHYKVVLLVAPSCGNQYKHMLHDHIAKLRRDSRLARQQHVAIRWWIGLAKNAWYAANVRRGWRLYKLSRQPAGQTLPVCNANKTVVLVCQDDPWSRGITATAATANPGFAYATYQGGHDDIWQQPQPFAALLKHLAKAA